MSVDLSLDGAIATLTLNRPEKLNALTLDMLYQLEQHIAALENATEIRALMITGAGERSFCVGADINAWADVDAISMWRNWIREGHRIFHRLAVLNLPTLAVLNGYTFGGGLELAMACDLRMASYTVSLALPEVKLGIIPGWAGTQRLPVLIGPARAKQMIFSGERVSAKQAEQWGLINEVVPPELLVKQSKELAVAIAANAPLAVQMAKQLIDGGLGDETGYRLEALASAFARYSDDAHEGIASFKEKREATFKGT